VNKKERLDVALVKRGLAESRERARAMILSGAVRVGQNRADKASAQVLETDEITVAAAPHPYVSRGGLKLEKAIRSFGLPAEGLVAVDIGASTGGFTDVLLRAGAKLVYAVDVGYGQLDWKLRNDSRVVAMERTNARFLRKESFPERPSLCVMDVSFISVCLLLPVIVSILGESGRIVTLIKPQFEAGRERVGKKGVVRDAGTHRDVLLKILLFIQNIGWAVQGVDFSPIAGPNGNIEFLFDIVAKESAALHVGEPEICRTVEAAHEELRQGAEPLGTPPGALPLDPAKGTVSLWKPRFCLTAREGEEKKG